MKNFFNCNRLSQLLTKTRKYYSITLQSSQLNSLVLVKFNLTLKFQMRPSDFTIITIYDGSTGLKEGVRKTDTQSKRSHLKVLGFICKYLMYMCYTRRQWPLNFYSILRTTYPWVSDSLLFFKCCFTDLNLNFKLGTESHYNNILRGRD